MFFGKLVLQERLWRATSEEVLTYFVVIIFKCGFDLILGFKERSNMAVEKKFRITINSYKK